MNLLVGDLDALGEGAQVIPPIAAAFNAHLVSRRGGERIDHVGRDGVAAGVFQRCPRAIRIGRGLIPKVTKTSCAFRDTGMRGLRHGIKKKNPDFGWRTPRDHLRGRIWEERLRIGLDKLREEGLIE